MHFVRHPFFERDLIGIVGHIVNVTQGDRNAALRTPGAPCTVPIWMTSWLAPMTERW